MAVGATDADAFPNAARAYKRDVNDPKRPGPMPGDLGLDLRLGQGDEPKVKECDNPPNCFSTTVKELDVGLHDLKPWRFSGKSPKDALQDVVEAVNAYEPGQQGIDGGGFQIKETGETYVYIQFESLRRGHIDDVEFFIEPGTSPEAKEGNLLVRSASRTGFYDFGVNAMRLNVLSDTLVKKGGWEASKITETTHPRYWGYNCDGGDGRRAPFSVRNKWPQMCVNPPPPNI